MIANQNNTVLVSAAIGWELAIKVNLGKFDALSLATELHGHTVEEGFEELPISMEQAIRAGLLPLHHRDQFDRLLVAQAQALNVPILSADNVLDQYDVKASLVGGLEVFYIWSIVKSHRRYRHCHRRCD
jgi:PIN domain nuclease of toxin-antitoxin system